MAEKVYNVRILQKQDSTDKWNSSPVILRNGEIGIEVLDDGKKKIKIGDGTSTWANLDYLETEAAANILDGIANGSIRTSLAAAETADYRMGTAAFASGQNTKAQGNFSKATNFNTIASGGYSSAEGRETQAKGSASHAGGYGTIAGSKNQTVIGKFNVEDTSEEYAFIIGDGENADSRANLFTVAWDGEVQVDGKKLATEEYVEQNGGKIDSISVNGNTQTITDKNVNITVPTKVSQLENDKNYLTTHQDISGKADKTYVDSQITEANKYTDDSVANLLNNSSEAVDSIFELRDAMEDNKDAIDVLTEIANTQSDWNQNDETAKDYIKNRPFYADETAEEIILQNQSFSFLPDEYDNTYYGARVPLTQNLILGELYKVTFDGQEYLLRPREQDGFWALGSSYNYYQDCPFIMFEDGTEGEYACVVLTNSLDESHEVGIIKLNTKTVPQEFLKIEWEDINNTPFILKEDIFPIIEDTYDFTNGEGEEAYSFYEEEFDYPFSISGGALHKITFDDKVYYLKASNGDKQNYNFSKYPDEEDDLELFITFSPTVNTTHFIVEVNKSAGSHFLKIEPLGNYELKEGAIPPHWHYLDDIFDFPSIHFGDGICSIVENRGGNNDIWNEPRASGNFSHVEGFNTTAASDYQHVQGKNNIEDAENTYAHIVGNGTGEGDNAYSNAHTLDWDGNAWFSGDIYVGSESGTNRDEGSKKVLTEEDLANISSVGESVEGKSFTYVDVFDQSITQVAGSGAEIFNKGDNIATGGNAHAEGGGTKATGWNSHSEGYYTFAYGEASHAEGYESQAIGSRGSHAEGVETKAYGHGSHAEGIQTKASENGSHAEGQVTISGGNGSHAEGQQTVAFGDGSHAEGIGSSFQIELTGAANTKTFTYDIVAGEYPLQVGQGIDTGAKVVRITAVDESTKTITVSEAIYAVDVSRREANVVCSFAGTIASHTEGCDTVANGLYQHVQGKNNIADTTSAHIVGNGTDETLSNAHTLDWDGNAWFSGEVYVGSTSGINKDEGSKKLATEEFVNQSLQNFTSGTQVQILTWEAND